MNEVDNAMAHQVSFDTAIAALTQSNTDLTEQLDELNDMALHIQRMIGNDYAGAPAQGEGLEVSGGSTANPLWNMWILYQYDVNKHNCGIKEFYFTKE